MGLRQADSEQDILVWLREKDLTPVSVQTIGLSVKKQQKSFCHKRIKSEEMGSLCWQLNAMIEGGVPITDAIDIIADDTPHLVLREVLQKVSEDMKTGETFSDSLARFPKIFNSIFHSMIMAGETSGSMPMVLKRLANYFDDRDKMVRKVKGAVAYPIFVVGFVVFIVVMMMVFIIPRFSVMFTHIKGELPAFTRGFMAVYNAIMHNGIYLVVGIGLSVFVLAAYRRTTSGHACVSRFLLKVPFVGRILSQSFISMFCRTLSTLLAAGVSIIEALNIMMAMTNNDVIKSAIRRTREHVIQGSSISLSMSADGFFPNMLLKMTQVGEESGSLPVVLDRTSQYYEKKVDSSISALTGFLEPALIVTVGVIVLVVILALYLPIFSLSGNG